MQVRTMGIGDDSRRRAGEPATARHANRDSHPRARQAAELRGSTVTSGWQIIRMAGMAGQAAVYGPSFGCTPAAHASGSLMDAVAATYMPRRRSSSAAL
jgi:hypothetical protein